jgi:hypothetical protein
MPVPYGMTPVDWSGISWPTHRSPVPRDSISSGSSSDNKDSNGDGDGDGEDRREGKYSRELLPARKRITVLPSLETRLLTSPRTIIAGNPHVNLTIRRMREDAFGNAGMMLYEGDSGSRNMEFWGELSRSLADVLPPNRETSLTTYRLVSRPMSP